MSKLVLGIVSIALAVISWFIFWWLSIVAIGLGIIGLCTKTSEEYSKYNTAGKALNIIGVVMGAVGFAVFLIALAALV